jgi:acyl carrier protein
MTSNRGPGKLREQLAALCQVHRARLERLLAARWGGRLDKGAIRRMPTTATEALVAEIWGRILSVSNISVDDHFFELGGHSMHAVQVIEDLHTKTGHRLNLADFFSHPTVASQAATLSALVPAPLSDSFLIPLRPTGSEAPLFVFPGGWGGEIEAIVFASMVQHLQRQIPVYIVRSRALDPTWEMPATLEEHVRAVLADIRKVQPRGPYTLLGECAAGSVAFELARQAAAEGDPAGCLLLLDSLPSNGRAGVSTPRPLPTCPPGVQRYFSTIARWRGSRVGVHTHIVLSSSLARRSSEYISTWGQFTTPAPQLHLVTVDHRSLVRTGGEGTARLLNQILSGRPEALLAKSCWPSAKSPFPG